MEVKVLDLKGILWFGKYKGKSIEEVLSDKPSYIEWCLEKEIFKLNKQTQVIFKTCLEYEEHEGCDMEDSQEFWKD